MEKLLNYSDALGFLNEAYGLTISDSAIRYWVFHRKIKHYKISGRIWFKQADLESFIKDKLREASDEQAN